MDREAVEAWKQPPFDEATIREVARLEEEDPRALEEAFSAPLSFGTGGMRGLMGIGISHLNIYTIQMATQGLASYLLSQFPDKQCRVVIGHDSRNHSREFAEAAAKVLSGNGIKALLFPELRPTPYVSFACRHLKCHAAIMITASHNPKEYNGYKVYWQDGAQVVAPHDKGIVESVSNTSMNDVTLSEDHIETVNVDDAYLEGTAPLSLLQDDERDDIRIAYTPLHGCGGTMIPKALEYWGFSHVISVESQIKPDGNFPTTKSPNPEDPKALEEGVKTMRAKGCDILLATDPDADRLGVALMHKGKPAYLTGNQTAALLLNYILTTKSKLPPNGAVVSTIVSSRLLEAITTSHKMTYFDVLTGFKYIGEKIHQWEQDKSHTFLFGAEESYGYLVGTHARDKDAIVCSCLISEMALAAKKEGHTLIDKLNELYSTYGSFYETQKSVAFPASSQSMQQMNDKMKTLSTSPPKKLSGAACTKTVNYAKDKTDLPPSNVLQLDFDNNTRLLVRPSGTEPKIKIYGQLQGDNHQTLHAMLDEMAQLLTS